MNDQNNPKNDKPIFNIERIYVKDLSFKSPQAPKSFLFEEQPEIDIKFNINNSKIDNNIYNNELTVSVSAKLPNKSFNNIVFECEVIQSGIFLIDNFNDEEIDAILHVTCPEIIFPYIRELISSLIQKAGFAPLYINPVNFNALYYDKQKNKNP